MADDDRRAMVESAAPSKSARPSWSAVSATAVSASGTRNRASAKRIKANPSALEMGYSFSRLSIAQKGGGFLRTDCTHGAAMTAAAAQSIAPSSMRNRWATTSASGR